MDLMQYSEIMKNFNIFYKKGIRTHPVDQPIFFQCEKKSDTCRSDTLEKETKKWSDPVSARTVWSVGNPGLHPDIVFFNFGMKGRAGHAQQLGRLGAVPIRGHQRF